MGEYVLEHVIEQNKVLQLSSLRLIYVNELEQNGVSNPDYQSEKLINQLKKHEIRDEIVFNKVSPGDRGCVSFYLVYSANITVTVDTVPFGYKLASTDKVKDIALLLCGIIRRVFSKTKVLPWPPTAEDMDINSDDLWCHLYIS